MTVKEILVAIKSLSSEDRWKVLEQLHRMLEPEIPEDIRAAMADVEAGRYVNMEKALTETPPPHLQ